MLSTNPVVLILGAGPNIGKSVACTFAARGYKVALSARSLKDNDTFAGQLQIHSDLSDPESVIKVFSKVKESLGFPSVVVYNGKRTFCSSTTWKAPKDISWCGDNQ